jgi:diguanylate cyclase (GGDEF)-like protein
VLRGPGVASLALGGLLLLAAWLAGLLALPAGYAAVAAVLAEILAAVSVLLAWRFRRSRLAAAALAVAVANVCVRGPLAAGIGGPASAETAALAVLLPLNLGLLAFLGDREVTRPAVLSHLTAVMVQPLLVAGLLRAEAVRESAVVAALRSPQAALLAVLFALLASLAAFVLRRGGFEAALLWAVVASHLAVSAAGDALRASLVLAGAQLALLVGALEDSSRLAFNDELTGLPGRRAFDDALVGLGGDYAVAMVDIDHFKRFNDRWGHEAGDQALRMVADELRDVRGGGRPYRYGGEEFAILFPGRPSAEAVPHLERLRVRVASRPFAIRSPQRPPSKPKRPPAASRSPRRVKLTVSIGLAGPGTRRGTPQDVLRAADRALYRAKSEGRNRVVATG